MNNFEKLLFFLLQFSILFALAVVTNAGHLALATGHPHSYGPYVVAPQASAYVKTFGAPAVLKTVDYEAPATYDFSYAVSDPYIGDQKSQVEFRHGNNVHGPSSLIDVNGFKSTFGYTTDEHNGFNGVVRREPLAYSTTASSTKVIAPLATVAKIVGATPVQYPAPFAKIAPPVIATGHYGRLIAGGAAPYAPSAYTAQVYYN